MSSFGEVYSRIVRPDGVRRLAQALWMMVGQPIGPASLLWATALLGWKGDEALWEALLEEGCVEGLDRRLHPAPLSNFLCRLWDATPGLEIGSLVWTLPEQLSIQGIKRDSYASAAMELVAASTGSLVMVSPYLEPRGVGLLTEALLDALRRGVDVVLLTHDAQDLSSLASASLHALRREGVGLPGKLIVYTASAEPPVLLHFKIVAADVTKAIVGSANLTGKGLGNNLEAGVVVGSRAAAEIVRVIHEAIAGGLATKTFSTK